MDRCPVKRWLGIRHVGLEFGISVFKFALTGLSLTLSSGLLRQQICPYICPHKSLPRAWRLQAFKCVLKLLMSDLLWLSKAPRMSENSPQDISLLKPLPYLH